MKLCSAGGKFWYHSIEEFNCNGNIIVCLETILSQIIIIKNKIPIREIIEPNEDKMFHVV